MAVRRSDIVFAALILLAVYVGWLLRDVLLLIYVAALFAVVLSPELEVIQKFRIGRWQPGRGIAVVVLAVTVLVLAALVLVVVVPPIHSEGQALVADWPRYAAQISVRLDRFSPGLRIDPQHIQDHASELAGGALGLARSVAVGVFAVFTWIILTIYFILDGHHVFQWAMSMVPAARRNRLEATLRRGDRRMRNWLLGQLGLMLALGTLSTITFGLLHLKYFFALGLFAGVMNIVPIIGPILSFVLAGTVALTDSWVKLVGVAAFYVCYQQFESGFLTPRIMRHTVDLPPLAVLTALIAGGQLAGVLGALIAVPSAALAAVLIDEYLVRREPAPVAEEDVHTSTAAL